MRGGLVIGLVLASLVARADSLSEARTHFDRGNAHYAIGEFAAAAEEYQAAYRLKQDPALLYNAAQAYRFAGNYDKALLLYRNFVLFYPNQPNVEEVKAQIARLKEAIATRTAPPVGPAQPRSTTTEPKPAPPPPEPKPTTPEVAPAAPSVAATAPSSGPELVATKPASEHKPIYKKWWLWTAVGGVVAAGVVVAVVLATPQPSWSSAPDFGPGAH